MRLAFNTTHNSGRYGLENYTLDKILALRDRLAAGIVPGNVIMARKDLTHDMGEGAELLIKQIRANVTEAGHMRKVGNEPAQVVIDRLEILKGTEGTIVVDGRTRVLAIALHFGITGKWLDYPVQVVDVDDQEAERLALAANETERARASWRARTAAFLASIKQGLITSEKEGQERYNLKRGSAQHAWSSATACRIHELDLSKCADGLTAADWRLVVNCRTKPEAEALAYNKEGKASKWSAPDACRNILATITSTNPLFPLVQAIAKGDAEAFDACFNA